MASCNYATENILTIDFAQNWIQVLKIENGKCKGNRAFTDSQGKFKLISLLDSIYRKEGIQINLLEIQSYQANNNHLRDKFGEGIYYFTIVNGEVSDKIEFHRYPKKVIISSLDKEDAMQIHNQNDLENLQPWVIENTKELTYTRFKKKGDKLHLIDIFVHCV